MEGGDAPCTGAGVAVVIPTMNRPAHLDALLASLAAQTSPCGPVVVVDGGDSVQHITLAHANRLDVHYLRCTPPGQLRQRRMGMELLRGLPGHRLVALLDDDILLEPDALENMAAFWNRAPADTAGVGFNIVNAPAHSHSWLMGLLLAGAPEQGRVLASGRNTSILNVSRDLATQWLNGGATVWRRDILEQHPQDDLRTRWAVGEDVRFSYPIGKRARLFVCASARVRDVLAADQAPPAQIRHYKARKEALALFYLTTLHPELSRAACLWMLLGLGLVWLANGVRRGDEGSISAARGRLSAFFTCLGSLGDPARIRRALED